MAKKNIQILILEDDISFRNRLENLCAEIGKTWVVEDVESALDLLPRQSFQLLLLNWNLIQSDFSAFSSYVNLFQSGVYRIALFQLLQLSDVIAAIKLGMNDVIGSVQNYEVIRGKVKESLSLEKPSAVAHAHVSRLVESLADRAVIQKTSLIKARKEFLKIFLQRIMSLQKMRRYQLAHVMGVSARSLHRHLSA